MSKAVAYILTAALLLSAADAAPLERDWLLQAGGKPTAERVRQEIGWTRGLAARLLKDVRKPDLSAELKQLDGLEEDVKDGAQSATELYLAIRRVKRAITFKNPAVDFSQVLLVDNPRPNHNHESGHRHGYRGFRKNKTGRLLVLEGLSPDSPVRSLVPEGVEGNFWRPDLSFDGKKVVFCMMPKEERSFHLYEVNVDGTGFRQLTFGDYDDLDPIFLPSGKLMFVTTRANSYVRCGPTHPSPVLARCDGDGKNIYVISRGMEPDFLPTLLPDGRIIYTRWEYTDKEQKRVQALWTMNPDGTGVAALWGNQSVWPDMLVEPRAIPGTGKIMFTGVGHHRWFDGSLGIIDPSKGMNYPDGLSKITPEIRWPEVGDGPKEKAERSRYRPGIYPAYKTPYPIGREDFLVSIKSPKTGKFSLYLMDLDGNRELIYAGTENVWHALPLKARAKPPVIPNRVEWPAIGPGQPPLKKGVLYSANVFEGAPLLPKDKVKQMRVLTIDAKTYSPWTKTYQHSGPSISITQADGVKRILGTTPVEPDGSVCFKAPPGVALHFQLLDKDYRCIQTMRSFTGVMPGETRGCVGCHEGRSNTPVNTSGGLAMRRGPLDLTPPPWGADVTIGYERFVQPVLDQYCGKCHQGKGKARDKLDLTFRPSTHKDPVPKRPPLPPQFTEPYVTLVGGGNDWYRPTDKPLNKEGHPTTISGVLNVEGYHDRTPVALETLKPMTHLSSASQLIDMAMDPKHIEAEMDELSLRKLIGWVDANGPYLGEEEIRKMPDPVGVDVPVKPRLRTAPRINRFNIRQDGDSSKVFLKNAAVETGKREIAGPGRPNIIIFLVDDMGLMDTSVPMLADENGNPKRHPLNEWYRTPGMERLAKQGVRFSNFYSHNVCSPTRVSIMTGQNSARHRTTDYIFPWQNNREIDRKAYPLAVCQQVPPGWRWKGLGRSDVTLPRQLQQAGYTTIHVGKAHFAPDESEGENPLNLGFDVNVGGTCIGAPGSYYGKNSFGKGRKTLHARPVPDLGKYHGQDIFLTEALTLEAKAEVDKAIENGKPFFLHMSHYAVHSPFQSDPRFAEHYRVEGKSKHYRAYATMIEGMDKSLGDLMDHLMAKGVAENTLVLFLGDNGGDAPIGMDDVASSAPLRGRKGAKWEGGMRVPFIAAWGKQDTNNPWQKRLPISANSIRQEIGACFDLLPTIAELVNAPVPADLQVDGQSLTQLLAGNVAPKHRNEFLNHYPHPRRGENHFFTTWRKGSWKVIYEYLKEGNDRYSLYHLATDPSESHNLATRHPEELKGMMQEMVQELESMDALYPVKDGHVLKPIIP